MKKLTFKKSLSLLLAAVLLFSAVSMTANQVDAAAYTGIQRQTDSPWHTVYFNGGSLAGTGCGLFSLVNAVGYLTGELMDVVELATWAHNNGMYNVTGADGTYRTSFYHRARDRYGEKFGFTIDCDSDESGYWSTASDARLKNHLIGGGTAVIHVYNHFMCLVGYNPSNGMYHLYDCAPADRRGTNVNGGDLWVSEAKLSSGLTDIDWFCLVSSTRKEETWIEKAAFDTMVYRDRNPDLAGYTDAQLKEHWLNHGIKEGRPSSPVFDLKFYLNNNPDLQQAFGTDYEAVYNHFITSGYKEKRKSSALFDGAYYTSKYPDVATSFKDEYLRHYMENGMKEGRRASLTFDPDYYWFIRPDVAEAWPGDYVMCAKHYAGHGIREQIEAYDNKHPVISNAVISDITSDGYTVTCTVTDNWGLQKVAFPTWTLANDQDDLAEDFMNTQKGTQNGTTYTFRVNASDHNNEGGKYVTHIYARDKGGNTISLALDPVEVKDPVIVLVSGSSYTMDGDLVSGIKEYTTVTDMLNQFANDSLEVVDCNGVVISGSAIVGTGAMIKLYQNGSVVDTATVVVSGDLDGNGMVDTTDYLRVKACVLSRFTFNAAQSAAADVDGDGSVSRADYERIKAYFLGQSDLRN